jgi:hypothetical protein
MAIESRKWSIVPSHKEKKGLREIYGTERKKYARREDTHHQNTAQVNLDQLFL